MDDKFPFTSIDDEFIHSCSFNSNWTCNCKNQLPSMPCNDSSKFKLLLNQKCAFRSFDPEFDEQFDSHHTLQPNFKYYETHEFHSLKDKVKNPFSLLHTNIRSLQYNADNLKILLANLEFKFDIIALSETWNPDFKVHTFQPPILDGYINYSGTPGSSLKGGCGLYINKDLKPLPRKDLNVKIKDADGDCEIETCWFELILDRQPNRLVGVVYRHPFKKDHKSIEIIDTTLLKIKK